MREMIILACGECKRKNYNKDKNKSKHSGRVENKKFCKFCRKHTSHKETK